MGLASSTGLQVLTVLGVPALLVGGIWAGARLLRWFQRHRRAAALVAMDLTLRGTDPGEGAGLLESVAELLDPD